MHYNVFKNAGKLHLVCVHVYVQYLSVIDRHLLPHIYKITNKAN